MKLTSQEEYGLRCLLRLAREGESLTIPKISQKEGISNFYVAKLMRILRRGGLVKSVRGQAGGYELARPADKIIVGEALAILGGRLYDPAFCGEHSGSEISCANTVDCSVRSLWRAVQQVIDQVLSKTTLKDLLSNEQEMTSLAEHLVEVAPAPVRPAAMPVHINE
ncbi:MAG TPA: Rrf2 family transcriptional regulator [Terriglobia bacterium]|nr:Rrf2 family transcriptional regulator [Terriglobia bacterium]